MLTAQEMRQLGQEAARLEARAYAMFFRAAEMQKINTEHRAVIEMLRAQMAASRERRARRASF